MAYDCNNSKPLSSTDANSVTTAYAYNDNLERLTQVRRAAGVSGVENQTNYIYPDANHVYVYTDQQTTADGALRVDTVYDGLGRVSARLQYGDPAGVIKTETTYDALGRVYSVSNPYRPRETVYWTTTSYDALGRVTSVMTSGDGATVTASYTGNQSTVTDQAGKKRTNTYDALGRLRVVIEDPGGPLNYGTNYFYDALDDLTSVSQGYCPNCQGRTFTYDAVRRLLMATNPESGTVSYGYDGAEIC
jgi:YD repeat-containing protein